MKNPIKEKKPKTKSQLLRFALRRLAIVKGMPEQDHEKYYNKIMDEFIHKVNIEAEKYEYGQ